MGDRIFENTNIHTIIRIFVITQIRPARVSACYLVPSAILAIFQPESKYWAFSVGEHEKFSYHFLFDPTFTFAFRIIQNKTKLLQLNGNTCSLEFGLAHLSVAFSRWSHLSRPTQLVNLMKVLLNLVPFGILHTKLSADSMKNINHISLII